MTLKNKLKTVSSLGLAMIIYMIWPAVFGPNYTIEEEWFTQPKNHNVETSLKFKQQVFTLVPKSVIKPQQAPILFVLGNETDATKDKLIELYKSYGSPQDMIFILAEHRGYGESVTEEDQSIPVYVKVDEALADYARLIEYKKANLKGEWIIAGYSYGGALTIEFAHRYPNTYDIALSSSAPIMWPKFLPEYAEKVSRDLDEELVVRLTQHSKLLSQNGSSNALKQQELLTGIIVGLAQMESQQGFLPIISALSHLSTENFMSALELILPQKAYNWANARTVNSAPKIPSERNWYTWMYQQCDGLGTFFEGTPFAYSQTQHMQKCLDNFGDEAYFDNNSPWQLSTKLTEITKPIIVVSGGRDPWIEIGVKPKHSFTNIDYVYDENWFHCPDRENPDASKQVMDKIRFYLEEQTL